MSWELIGGGAVVLFLFFMLVDGMLNGLEDDEQQ